MRAHIARRHVARINRRKPRGEQCDKGGLRSFQPKGDFAVAVRHDLLKVTVPRLTGVDAQLFARSAGQHIPGAHDIFRRERFAVVPLHPFAEPKRQLRFVLVPRPVRGEIGDDRLEAALRHVLFIHNEIIEDAHHRALGGDRRLLVDRHARRAVEEINLEDAPRFLRQNRVARRQRPKEHTGCCQRAQISFHLPVPPQNPRARASSRRRQLALA